MKKILIAYAVRDERIAISIPNYSIEYVQTGIGKVKAAIWLCDAIYENRPDLVINIGTAGSLKIAVGEVVVCTSFVDRDLMAIEGLPLEYKLASYSLLIRSHFCCDWKLGGSCNTGDSFVTHLESASESVYDMEAYALAEVCQLKKIPFVAVKYVSDRIGENSIAHWEEKLADAREGLGHFFETHGV